MEDLFATNTPENFWRICNPIPGQAWASAFKEARTVLPGHAPAINGNASLEAQLLQVLGEGQFGPDHWKLSRTKEVYYQLRPLLPSHLRPIMRRYLVRSQRKESLLGWPIEDRYVRFQFELVNRLLKNQRLISVPFINFWPGGKRFAFVLTHDVESNTGQAFIRKVVELEEQFGFHSSFNFVTEGYATDSNLVKELRHRGFEVGIHGLKHDGKLFSSYKAFLHQAQQINEALRMWRAVGFRAPMTHRHPEWMQALEIQYDSSFFDTDPFEPIPGGTMSIWPFFIGHFVELPYTLAQDHTLTQTLGETTPILWLEKLHFIRQHQGMALVNTHPDYLRDASAFSMYEAFLRETASLTEFWHALPREVARWWRHRAEATVNWEQNRPRLRDLAEGSIGEIRVTDQGTGLICENMN